MAYYVIYTHCPLYNVPPPRHQFSYVLTFNPQSVNKEATLCLPGPFVKAQHKLYVTKNKNENTRSLLYLSETSIPLRGDAVHKMSMKSIFTHETYIIPFFSVSLLCGWTIRIEHLMEIVLVISQVVCMFFFPFWNWKLWVHMRAFGFGFPEQIVSHKGHLGLLRGCFPYKMRVFQIKKIQIYDS